MFTQPLMYKAIAEHPHDLDIYGKKLIGGNIVTAGEVEKIEGRLACSPRCRTRRREGYRANRPTGSMAAGGMTAPAKPTRRSATGPASIFETLRDIGGDHHGAGRTSTCPHAAALLRDRHAIDSGSDIDWSIAEALAFCSLLLDGHTVPLSASDVSASTFSPAPFRAARPGERQPLTPFDDLRGQARYRSSTGCCRRPCSASVLCALRSPSRSCA